MTRCQIYLGSDILVSAVLFTRFLAFHNISALALAHTVLLSIAPGNSLKHLIT